jgi:hypothetical protein
MEIKDALDIMNSDFKLWEYAADEDLGNGTIAKTITLPWGIGEYTVNMEGMNDAIKRRGAVSAYGEHIRGVINERINDESITSRAQAAAAEPEPIDSGYGDGVSGRLGVLDETVQAEPDEEAKEAHQGTVEGTSSFGDDLVAERAKVDARIGGLTDDLARLCKQLRGIDAAIKAMEDNDEDSTGPS